jgi:hypothetical protein
LFWLFFLIVCLGAIFGVILDADVPGKSGHLAPPSGMQKRFEQFSRQAQAAQLCLGMGYVLDLRLFLFL